MKNKLLAAVLALAVTFGAAPIAAAQGTLADGTDLNALRAAVKADKRAYVASALQLTPEEAKKFWPVYDAYQRKLDVTSMRRGRMVEEILGRDRPMSDAYAKNLVEELVAIDEEETRALRALARQAQKALPARKAARYLQIESKIRATQAYDIAAVMPLVK